MRISCFISAGFMLCVFVVSGVIARGHGPSSGSAADHFDYYLMSLSWSPSFCETHPDETDQCSRKGFGFVLHGLWPQNQNGSWPQHCSGGGAPDEATVERTLAFMPSRHLIEHEWQTHGTCSGLDAQGYFELADRAFAQVKIPPALSAPQSAPNLSAADLVQAFVQVNPGLDESMISVACHNGSELSEVHVCMNKDNLAPQACGGRVHNSCRYGSLPL